MRKLYHIPAARTDAQRQEMETLQAEGICRFCPEHIIHDVSPISIETDHWVLKKNTYPYANTRHHFLAIPKEHVTKLTDLTKPAQADFYNLLAQCEQHYTLTSYSLVTRSGDMEHTAGSIAHLHTHIIVGDTDNPDHEPVRVRISSRY